MGHFKSLWIVAVLAAGRPDAAVAEERPLPLPIQIRIVPGSREIGDTITVEVYLAESRQISCVQFALEYDPAILEPRAPRPWMKGNLGTDMIDLWNRPVNSGGGSAPTGPHSDGIGYAGGTFEFGWHFGPGVLVSAEFTVLARGYSPLRFPNPYGFWSAGHDNPVIMDDDSFVYPTVVTESIFSNLAPGITCHPAGGLVTNEAGGWCSFTVVLDSPPEKNVGLAFRSSNWEVAAVSPPQVTFTPSTWNLPQILTVTGRNYDMAAGNVPYSIIIDPAVSEDPAYLGWNADDVAGINLDDESPAVLLSLNGPLVTSEAGEAFSIKAVLTTAPTADVLVPVTSSDPGEGRAGSTRFLFTPANWNVPQTVTLTGVDDSIDDGDSFYVVHVGAAESLDLIYSGLDRIDIQTVNRDDDSPGIRIEPGIGFGILEGASTQFTMVLTCQPLQSVSISIASSDPANATVFPPALTFSVGSWNIPQAVTVTGIDDARDDENIQFMVVTGDAESLDPSYDGMIVPDIAGTVADNDESGILVVATPGLNTTEGGGTAMFSVRLACEPGAMVTIPVASSDPTEGSVNSPLLIFDADTWNTPRIVTIRGVDDSVDDGSISYSVILGAAVSGDGNYDGLNPQDVYVSNRSDDADLSLLISSGLRNPAEGDEVTFLIVLVNGGQSDADGVIVSSILPAALPFRAASASAGSYQEGTGRWMAGALPVGTEVTLTITASVAEGTGGTIARVDAAIVDSDQDDPNPANDSAVMIFNLQSAPAQSVAGGKDGGGKGGGCAAASASSRPEAWLFAFVLVIASLSRHRGLLAILGLMISGLAAQAQEYPTGDWKTKDEPPDPMPAFSRGGVAADENAIYFIGGVTSSEPGGTRDCFQYEPPPVGWKPMASLPSAVWGNSTVRHGKYLYSFGNLSTSAGATIHVLRLDTSDPGASWDVLGVTLPAALAGASSVAISKSRILLTGGLIGGNPTSNCFEFIPAPGTPAGGQFVELKPMTVAMAWHATAVVDSTELLFVVGVDGALAIPALTCLEYNPSSDSWRSLGPVRVAGLAPQDQGYRMFAHGDRLYVFGGTSVGADLPYTLEYNPPTARWTRRADMATPRSFHGAAVMGGIGYAYGGAAGSTERSLETFSPPDFGTPPLAPTTSGQNTDPQLLNVAQGGWTNAPRILLSALVRDPDPGDAIRLEIQVKAAARPDWTRSEILTSLPMATDELAQVTLTIADQGGYDWRYRVVDRAGNYAPTVNGAPSWIEFMNNAMSPDFSVDRTPPAALSTISPEDGAVLESDHLPIDVIFEATESNDPAPAAPGLLSYQIHVAADPDFLNLAADFGDLPNPTGSVRIFAAGEYHWRARALDALGNHEEWNMSASFRIKLREAVSLPSSGGSGCGAGPVPPGSLHLLLLVLIAATGIVARGK